ncbi:MAG: anti-sigma factor domain-containing protein [Cellulosilyticaceae bacterium]
MIKGIILSVASDHAILLGKDGGIYQIKKKNQMRVGQAILVLEEDLIPAHKKSLPTWMPALAAAALLLFMLPVVLLNARPYGVLSLDINPSVEFDLTRDGKIKSVESKNIDADTLALKQLEGKNLSQAMALLKQRLISSNYLVDDDYILASYTQLRGSDDRLEKLAQAALLDIFDGSNIIYIPATKQDYKNAQAKNLSLGRYEAGLLATQDNDDIEAIDTIDLDDLTVEQLLALLKSPTIKTLSPSDLDDLMDDLGDFYKHDDLDDLDDKDDSDDLDDLDNKKDSDDLDDLDDKNDSDDLDDLDDKNDSDDQDDDHSQIKPPASTSKPVQTVKPSKPDQPNKPSKPVTTTKPSHDKDDDDDKSSSSKPNKPPKPSHDKDDKDDDHDDDDDDNDDDNNDDDDNDDD